MNNSLHNQVHFIRKQQRQKRELNKQSKSFVKQELSTDIDISLESIRLDQHTGTVLKVLDLMEPT
jgi:hypothetical protein